MQDLCIGKWRSNLIKVYRYLFMRLLRASQWRTRGGRTHKKETSCWAFSETSPELRLNIFSCLWRVCFIIWRFFAYALSDDPEGWTFERGLRLRGGRYLKPHVIASMWVLCMGMWRSNLIRGFRFFLKRLLRASQWRSRGVCKHKKRNVLLSV